MKVYLVLLLFASIIILFQFSKITFIDIIIFLYMIYISNKTILMIGKYIKNKREQQKFELILENIEKKLKCQGIQ